MNGIFQQVIYKEEDFRRLANAGVITGLLPVIAIDEQDRPVRVELDTVSSCFTPEQLVTMTRRAPRVLDLP